MYRLSVITTSLCLSALVCAAPAIEQQAPAQEDYLLKNQLRDRVTFQATMPSPPQKGTTLRLTSAELAQRPELLHRLLESLVQDNNGEGIAKFLPLYQKLPNADTSLIAYAQALLSRAQGDYPTAITLLRKLIADNPDAIGIRLQLAITLAQNQEITAAKDQFNKIRADKSLSTEDIAKIETLEARLAQQKQWDFTLNFRYLSENNVNNAPKDRQYGNWTFPTPEKAHGIGYNAGGSYTRPIADHWSWQSNLNLYGKTYWDNHAYDDLLTHVDTGIAWRDARKEIRLAPYMEYRRYGGKTYSRGYGISSHFNLLLSPHWQNFSTLQLGRTIYPNRDFLTGNNQYLSTTFLYRVNPQQNFYGGLSFNHSNARDASDRYHRIGARLGWGQEWAKGISTNAEVSIARRQYHGADLFNIKRQDTEYNFDFSIWNRSWHFYGLTPRLTWQVNENKSNHPLYRYGSQQIFLQVSKTF